MEQNTNTHRHIKLTFTVCEKHMTLTEVIDIARELARQHPHCDAEVTSTNITHSNKDN